MSGTTAEQFKTWQARARAASNDSVAYVIRDCAEAAEAMRGWNPAAEARYMDEYFVYVDERRARQVAGRWS